MQILISAGEASGEMYGAELIEALRARVAGRVSFFGAGGDRMRAAGCDIVVDAKDLAVVGITEIVSHLPKILGLYKKLIRAADQRRPDLAVVIDSPAFNWRVARQMRKRGIPVVYYVCPQFWAWRQGRVKLLRKYVDKALVIFPFEEKFYCDRGVDATFVGHPLANLPAPTITREAYAAEHGPDPAKQWIALMPGSRRKELRMNLPTMLAAAELLGSAYEFLLPVARTLDAVFVRGLIQARQAASLRQGHRVRPVKVRLVSEALPALFHARAGIIASGTATVEAAIMGTPFVMVYRVSPLTYALGKPRVKLTHYAMVNLIASLGGRNNVDEVVPELVQNKFTAANIVSELNKIISDGGPRTRMIQGLAAVKAKLRQGSRGQSPPEKAADIILAMLGQKARNARPS
ncbi:MAG: lipid-A-disaccharide synthase [Terriglobales bacterium]